MIKVLFVCLGNICRSCAAEGVMKTLIEAAGLEKQIGVDSAGISAYHQGDLPDARMRSHAADRGYILTHRSRQIKTLDFERFDLIIGMDDSNMDDLRELAPTIEAVEKLHRLTDYCAKHTEADHVPDPYYGGSAGFEYVLDLVEDACQGLLDAITKKQ